MSLSLKYQCDKFNKQTLNSTHFSLSLYIPFPIPGDVTKPRPGQDHAFQTMMCLHAVCTYLQLALLLLNAFSVIRCSRGWLAFTLSVGLGTSDTNDSISIKQLIFAFKWFALCSLVCCRFHPVCTQCSCNERVRLIRFGIGYLGTNPMKCKTKLECQRGLS